MSLIGTISRSLRDARRTLSDVAEAAAGIVDEASEKGGGALDFVLEVRESAGDLLEEAVDRAGDAIDSAKDLAEHVVDTAADVVGDVGEAVEDGVDFAGRKVGSFVRSHPRVHRAVQPVGVCADMIMGAAKDARARFDTVLEFQVFLDPEHPFRLFGTSTGNNSITTGRDEKLLRVTFLGDKMLPGESHVSMFTDDGFGIAVRALSFREVEVSMAGPDGEPFVSKFTLDVDEWAIGTGPHQERLLVTRYRSRDYSMFRPLELKDSGPGRFRKIHCMRFD